MTEWINVKDKLPDPNTYTLTYDGKKIEILKYVGSSQIGPITHWMPLPEPPNDPY